MGNKALRLYQNLVITHPWFWLIFVVLVSFVAAFHARDFHLDASADSLIMENDPALKYFRETGQKFKSGGGSFLIISFRPKSGDLFSRTTLDELASLQNDLRQLPSIQSSYSMLDVPLLFSPQQSFQALASEVRTLSDTSIDPAIAENEFTQANPMYRNFLVSKDGKTAALFMVLKRDQALHQLLDEREALRQKRLQNNLTSDEAARLKQVEAEYSQYMTDAQSSNTSMIADIRHIMSKYESTNELFLGGLPMVASDMIGYIKSDLKTFGTAVIACLVLLLFVIFRQPRWVLIPLLCCSLSTLWVVGWLGWMGWKVTVISSNFIALLLIIDISLAIYLIVRYRELQADFPDADTRWLVEQACILMIRPCLCMVLAAMVGFGSLVVSGIRPVIDFGWMMAIGIGVSLPVCYLLFPSLVQLLPKEKALPNLNDITLRISKAIGRATERHLHLPAAIGVVLVILIGWGASQLTVENRFIDYFRHNTEIYQGMYDIDQNLGGTTPLDIVIDAPPRAEPTPGSTSNVSDWNDMDTAIDNGFALGGADDFDDDFGTDADVASDGFAAFDDGFTDDFNDDFGNSFDNNTGDTATAQPAPKDNRLIDSYWFTPERLTLLVDIQHYLESIPTNGKVLSLGTTYELATKLNNGPLSYVQLMLLANFLPDTIRQQLVTPFLSEDGRSVRMMIRVIDSDKNLNRNDLIKKIQHDLTTQFDLEPEQVHLTGAMVLYNNMLQSLFDSQIKTLGIVILVIFLILLMLFRSIKMAFIAILPNTISATSILGLMGFMGLPLDLMSITITSITIGLAVNDSIHYIYRFYEEFPIDHDYLACMHRCHGSITTAMCYTSSMIVIGFALLTLSNFMPTVYFGILTGIAIIVALAANLTLLPALLVILKPHIPKQAVEAPIPQRHLS